MTFGFILKIRLLPCAAAAALSLLSGCQLFQKSEAWDIVMHSKIPGRGDEAQSDSYARELQRRLAAHGIDARVVAFHYGVNMREGGPVYTRSAVVYRNDTTPKVPWWLMDNTLNRPVWLPNATVEEQLRFAEKQPELEVIPAADELSVVVSAVRSTARRTAAPDWQALFQQKNGTPFNAQSDVDRKKMAELKEEPRR